MCSFFIFAILSHCLFERELYLWRKRPLLPEVPVVWKQRVARLVRIPLVHRIMLWGVHLTVPRQRIGVAVIAVDDQERVLLLRHVFHPFTPWGLPGGWLNRNEAPAEAALRELKEETGLTAVLGPVVHIVRDSRPAHIGIAYLARILPGPLTLSPEIIEGKWFAVDDLPAQLLPFVRSAIERALVFHRVYDLAAKDKACKNREVL